MSSGTRVLTEVSQTATVGDFEYRKAALTDGSTGTITWRIAVSIGKDGRTRVYVNASLGDQLPVAFR